MTDFNHPDSFDGLEHIKTNWGFQPSKAVSVVEGVPTAGFKSNPTVAISYTSSPSYGQQLTQVDKYILSGSTVCNFRRTLSYNTDGELSNVTAWTLI